MPDADSNTGADAGANQDFSMRDASNPGNADVGGNIRECLGEFIGTTIMDIVQQDHDYFERTGRSYVELLMSNGDCLRFYITDETPICVNVSDEAERERFGDPPLSEAD